MFKFSNIKSIKTKAVNIKVLHIEKYIKIRYDNKQEPFSYINMKVEKYSGAAGTGRTRRIPVRKEKDRW